jgi:hypothetical protein
MMKVAAALPFHADCHAKSLMKSSMLSRTLCTFSLFVRKIRANFERENTTPVQYHATGVERLVRANPRLAGRIRH